MAVIASERYDVDPAPIGRGGFGEVYRAFDNLFDRDVVIKTIVASQLYGIDDARIRRQFFKESAISAKLGQVSEYIVKVLDFGYDRDSDEPFFVMEFIDGHDLTREVGQFSWENAFMLFDQMLCALESAHSNGVVHSDISPDNIMFDKASGHYKLNDFGLARLLNSNLMTRGSIKSLVGGKPAFLPPGEFHSNDRSPYSDLYALAVTLTQLLTGQLPKLSFEEGAYSLERIREIFGRRPYRGLVSVSVQSYIRHGSIISKIIGNRQDLPVWRIKFDPDKMVELLDAIVRQGITSIGHTIELSRRMLVDVDVDEEEPETPKRNTRKRTKSSSNSSK